ncbi:hypothetical protein U91I_00585 [alpha proteobacterium U9-1i]|nr:hypothetical protein U91I_00585 [alpha proteobacterium U9-1i]
MIASAFKLTADVVASAIAARRAETRTFLTHGARLGRAATRARPARKARATPERAILHASLADLIRVNALELGNA